MSQTLPDLIDALYAGLTNRWDGLQRNISDGVPMTFNSGDYFVLGYSEWDPRGWRSEAGSSEEDWAGAEIGAGFDESGTLVCAAWSQNGSRDVKAARDAVYAMHSDLRTYLLEVMRNDTGPSPYGVVSLFGIPGLYDVRVGGATNLIQGQNENGALAVLVFPVPYRSRIEGS